MNGWKQEPRSILKVRKSFFSLLLYIFLFSKPSQPFVYFVRGRRNYFTLFWRSQRTIAKKKNVGWGMVFFLPMSKVWEFVSIFHTQKKFQLSRYFLNHNYLQLIFQVQITRWIRFPYVYIKMSKLRNWLPHARLPNP